jgi:hypothetical protein
MLAFAGMTNIKRVIPSFEMIFSVRPEECAFHAHLEGQNEKHLLRMNGKV